jgi:hypothetical protein
MAARASFLVFAPPFSGALLGLLGVVFALLTCVPFLARSLAGGVGLCARVKFPSAVSGVVTALRTEGTIPRWLLVESPKPARAPTPVAVLAASTPPARLSPPGAENPMR